MRPLSGLYRIGRHLAFGPWWFRVHLGCHKKSKTFYGTWYVFRKRVWWIPIDYERIENKKCT
jgi:hypothetical protein